MTLTWRNILYCVVTTDFLVISNIRNPHSVNIFGFFTKKYISVKSHQTSNWECRRIFSIVIYKGQIKEPQTWNQKLTTSNIDSGTRIICTVCFRWYIKWFLWKLFSFRNIVYLKITTDCDVTILQRKISMQLSRTKIRLESISSFDFSCSSVLNLHHGNGHRESNLYDCH